MDKLSLNKYETAFLLASKGWDVNLKYEYDYSFEFKTENEEILNNVSWYKQMAYIYADWCAIPIDSVKIEHLNTSLYVLFEKLQPNKTKFFISEVIYMSSKVNKNTFIFKFLYGHIQNTLMIDENNENIYILDKTLIKEPIEKDIK